MEEKRYRSSEEEVAGHKRAVLAFCETANPPIARGAVMRATGLNKNRASRALLSLVRAGKLTREGTKRTTVYFPASKKQKPAQANLKFDHLGQSLRVIPLDKLRQCRMQPDSRTDAGRMRDLDGRIDDDRIYSPPVVVPNGDGTFTIADGHRRCFLARSRGQTHIRCIVVDDGTSAEDLWVRLNAGTNRFRSSTWFIGWGKLPSNERTAFLDEMPPSVRANVRLMVEIFGEAKASQLALEEWISPEAARLIVRLHELIARSVGSDKAPTVRQVGEWLLESRARRHDMHGFLAVANAKSIRKFVRAIRLDKDFSRGEWV